MFSLFNPTSVLRKKAFTQNPGKMHRGGKNTIWRPKMGENQLRPFLFLDFEHPRRRPDSWKEFEVRRLGIVEWPKSIGFYNKGDNFEITPEMAYRLFRRNKDEDFWTPEDNEQAIINMIPLVEKNPGDNISKVEEIFAAHVERFGTDHIIYNAVLQAIAFTHDFARCNEIFQEMRGQGLAPNGQSYVNMMLACQLDNGATLKDDAAKKEKAAKLFNEAVKDGALEAVMRLDTEFQMWWDQLERFGSFTSEKGFLSHIGGKNSKNNSLVVDTEEGARPAPQDPYRLWGWDSRTERKFAPRQRLVRDTALTSRRMGNSLGSVFQSYKREPWHLYKGMFPHDYTGPAKGNRATSRAPFDDAPPASAKSVGGNKNVERCGPAY